MVDSALVLGYYSGKPGVERDFEEICIISFTGDCVRPGDSNIVIDATLEIARNRLVGWRQTGSFSGIRSICVPAASIVWPAVAA